MGVGKGECLADGCAVGICGGVGGWILSNTRGFGCVVCLGGVAGAGRTSCRVPESRRVQRSHTLVVHVIVQIGQAASSVCRDDCGLRLLRNVRNRLRMDVSHACGDFRDRDRCRDALEENAVCPVCLDAAGVLPGIQRFFLLGRLRFFLRTIQTGVAGGFPEKGHAAQPDRELDGLDSGDFRHPRLSDAASDPAFGACRIALGADASCPWTKRQPRCFRRQSVIVVPVLSLKNLQAAFREE